MPPELIDLSVPIQLPLEGEMTEGLSVTLAAEIQYNDHDDLAERAAVVFGCEVDDLPDRKGWASEILRLSTHAGTHIDAPYHYFPTCEGKPAKTIDQVPLDACFGNGVVLDLRGHRGGERVGRAAVERAVEVTGAPLVPGEIVLLRFGADATFGTAEYWQSYPGLDAEATRWLCEKGIRTMGTDAVGFDRDFATTKAEFQRNGDPALLWEAHRVGIDHEYFHMEKLANLGSVPTRGFVVSCFPVKIKAASAAWVRAVAILGLELA
jgi:kynurenine formamidase